MLSEKVVLLGKGLYKTIPDEVMISSVPTASELEYVGAEDFDRTMIQKILPKVVEGGESMDFKELLEIDYDWLCRCLRMKSYGPFYTTNRVFCPDCGEATSGEYVGDLRTIDITVLPEGFINKFTIKSDEFINLKHDIEFHLLTIGECVTLESDNSFNRPDGSKNIQLARLCYMIDSIGMDKNLTPIQVKSKIQNLFDVADYEILKDCVREFTNYGLHSAGRIRCPKCQSEEAYFLAFQSDKFFRPTVGDIREWKSSIRSGNWKKLLGNPSDFVRVDSERDDIHS